jgi:glycosyltransferase involved in cell wall biosynthesis
MLKKTMQPLTVAMIHYLDDARIGGSLRVGQLLANHVDPNQIQAHLIFVYGTPGPVAEISKIPCHYPNVKGRFDLVGWLRVRKLLKRLKPDIIHFQDPLTVLRLFVKNIARIKVTHCHGKPLFPPHTWLQRLEKFWQRQTTDCFICINPSAAQTLVEFKLARPKQCQVLPNAVDVSWLEQKPDRLTARKSLNLPTNCKILGIVGRVIQSKGFPDLFRITQQLPLIWQVAVFGDGQDRLRLEEQVRNLGLGDRFFFLGSLDDIRMAYGAIDALIFLSQHEPFGLILAEAMACRVPVFGLHGMGEYRELEPPLIDEQIATFWERERPERFLAPPERSIPESDTVLQPLWEALSNFDPDSPAIQQKLELAFQRIHQHYNVTVQADRMTHIYQELVTSPHEH